MLGLSWKRLLGPAPEISLGVSTCRKHAFFLLHLGLSQSNLAIPESSRSGSCRTRTQGHRLLGDTAVGTVEALPRWSTAKEVSPSCLIWVEKPEPSPRWSQPVERSPVTSRAGRQQNKERREHDSGAKFIFLEMVEPWLQRAIAFHSQRLSPTFPQTSCPHACPEASLLVLDDPALRPVGLNPAPTQLTESISTLLFPDRREWDSTITSEGAH